MGKPERDLVRVQGYVTSELVKGRTASEHTGVVLQTANGERFTLVRLGGNPFADEATRQLVGRKVEVEGYRIGSELRYIEAHEIA